MLATRNWISSDERIAYALCDKCNTRYVTLVTYGMCQMSHKACYICHIGAIQ